MRTAHFKPAFVETFPGPLEPGIIYISLAYKTCAHLCACGCGAEVITPLSPAQWSFIYDGEEITLHPSVGNWALDCRSHYVISRGRVRWGAQLSDAEIASNRRRDRGDLEAHATRDGVAEPQRPDHRAARAAKARSRWRARVARWLGRQRSEDADNAVQG